MVVREIGRHLTLEFEDGVRISVKLNEEERRVLSGLVKPGLEIPTAEALSGSCPLESRLPAEDFKKVRTLKKQLGSGVAAEWIIIDFCIHPVVHKDFSVDRSQGSLRSE